MWALTTAVSLAPGAAGGTQAAPPWRADHHVHLATPDLCARVGECLETNTPSAVYAADAVRALDAANVAKGVVLSCAYLYGLPSLKLAPPEVARLSRLENEFTAAEVAKYPGRLVGFLSVDPLEPSALAELQHWRGSTQLTGLKLHLTADGVNLRRPADRHRVAAVVAEAARQHLPMVMHIGGGAFGAAEAELFIKTILPSAGKSWVQVAHAADGLPLLDDNHVAALRVFADHFERNDPATRRVLFDLSYVPDPDESADTVKRLVQQMRRIGLSRFVFGSDFNVLTPAAEIDRLRRLELTPAEWDTVRNACAPWAC
jgi:predicted TIM-barrel fold metal-dependent hydrolase